MKLLKNTQLGRSMVEMLGVLAIIGVLSVGGIAGYSKAMYKYKLNQTLDALSQIVANIIALDGKSMGTPQNAQDFINYGIIPDCDVNYVDIEGNKGSSCPLPLGEIYPFVFDDPVSGYNTFDLYIRFLSNQNPVESCIQFFTSEIYKNVPDSFWKSKNNNKAYINVDNTVTFYKEQLSSLTAADISDACTKRSDRAYREIVWRIYTTL